MLISCFNANASRSVIHAAIQGDDVQFITGSGHGEYDRFTGQGGATVWNTSAHPPRHVNGKFVHLLSCQTGGLLGLLFVANGALAFWGYSVDFTFYCQRAPPADLSTDTFAKPFFLLDAIIDVGILNGYDANAIQRQLDKEFWKAYARLLSSSSSQSQLSAIALLDNFVHLVCPARSWGNAAATL
ncbi:MAG: hypothetical protein M3464_20850 [Chloroflexota bacterium]|nr:hypothetical protein [Chloroflexota bacterium]